MSQHSINTLQYRGWRERTVEDQQQAMIDGYPSVTEWALDQLGRRVIELEQRVASLEGGEVAEVEEQE